MSDVLLALHIIGLMMGAGGGFGSMIVGRTAAARPPQEAAALRSLGPALARFSTAGLALMLASGLGLVFVKYGGFAGLPGLFWVKMVFVATLTMAAIALEFAFARMKSGDAGAAAQVPVLGPVAGVSSLLAVIFAIFAFH